MAEKTRLSSARGMAGSLRSRPGDPIFNPHRVRVRTYDVTVEPPEDEDPQIETFPVTIEDGMVVVHV